MSTFHNEQSFRFLWIGQMLANLGDVLYIVSLTAVVYHMTKSVTFMSLIPFVITMTALVSGIVAPLMIEKYQLKAILSYSQVGKTIFLLVLCLMALHISIDRLWLVYIVIGCISFVDGAASPARNALVPSLIDDEHLVKANSFLAMIDQITRLVAWPAGSILMIWWGQVNMLWLTFLLFTTSSIFMCLIKVEPIEKSAEASPKLGVIKEGWQIIWNSKQLRIINVMTVLETVAGGVWIAAIILVFVEEALDQTQAWWGIINAAFFAGMLLSGALVYRYSKVMEKNLGQAMMWSSFFLMVLTLWFGTTSIAWLAAMISLLYGLPQMARDVAEVTIIQRNAKKELLAKVYSARDTLIYGSFGISSLLFGYITDYFGVRITFTTAAGFCLLSFLIAILNRTNLVRISGVNNRNRTNQAG